MALRRVLCASMLVAASPASAAEDFIKGVYLQTQELCAQAKKDTLQTLIDAGNVILSADGLQSVEYNCEFVQITKAIGAGGLIDPTVAAWIPNVVFLFTGLVLLAKVRT